MGEPLAKRVLACRARYGTLGGCHKIEALISIPPGFIHEVKTDYYMHRETRQEWWEVWVIVYVGLDYEAASAAYASLLLKAEKGLPLTE